MIKIENLDYKIAEYQILKNINLEIEENEIVVLVGSNGCGKSTLVKCIASLLEYKGEITVNGQKLKELKHKERSRVISYLPQNCVRTNIKVDTLVRHSRFAYREFGDKLSIEDKKAISDAKELTGVENILNKNLMDISGGERQLAYLTMVLAQDTPIILLDEPNTFLDIEHQLFLFEVVKKLKARAKTILIVLHDLIQALEIADKIVVIEKGEVIKVGKPTEVIDSIEKTFNIKIAEIEKVGEIEKPIYRYCLVQN